MTGLTDAEAATRRARGQGNTAPPSTTRTYGQIVRENVFTFINNVIFALGIALALVGRPVDAVVSLGVISTNIVVSVVQEIRAKRTLDRIALLTRPTATVVRGGQARTVRPEELVLGDLVSISVGDQVVLDGRLAEGRLAVDESLLTGESDHVMKGPGDAVFSGSFAVTGSGRYVVEQVGTASLANRITAGARSFRRVLTPLQREVHLVIRMALLVVAYLLTLLAIDALLTLAPAREAIGEAALLVGLVPNGLFVSIAIAYALAAVRIARHGALVQQSNAVESLSSVDVLCLDKTGTLTANRLTVAEILPLQGTDADVRAVLGATVASAATRNRTAAAIAEACPADARPLAADVPFSAARRWSAVAFAPPPTGDAGAPRGVVALGAPPALRPYLADGDGSAGGARAWAAIEAAVAERARHGLRVLLVAADRAASELTDAGEATRLPRSLAPLGLVCLQDEIREGASAALAGFRATGVRPVIISGDDPETVAALARQAGLGPDLKIASGPEIEALDDAALAAVAAETDVFGRITPTEKERLVRALRARGQYVAMIGDGVNDVLSLKQANLAVAMQGGSQAARSVADIILTNDSFAALLPAVQEGQRILNGMQAILSVFLTRITTFGLVIVSSLVIGVFPLALRNASVIILLTVGLPSALLAFWAQPGTRERETLGRTILRLVTPAAILSSLLGLGVLYGTLVLRLAEANEGYPNLASGEAAAIVAAATPVAQTALTAFLVLTGLALLAFVEPPFEWFAVARERTPDRRPFLLAAGLGVLFVAGMGFAPARALFDLQPLGLADVAIVAAASLAWLLLTRLAWKTRAIERFLGLASTARAPAGNRRPAP